MSAAGQRDYDLHKYPVAAMERMEDERLLGKRMFTTDAWGGYTIWRYWPAQRVFMDDRYDMYPVELVEDYNEIADVKPAWRETLDRWEVEVVLWPKERALTQVLAEDEGWTRVYGDKTAVLYARAGGV